MSCAGSDAFLAARPELFRGPVYGICGIKAADLHSKRKVKYQKKTPAVTPKLSESLCRAAQGGGERIPRRGKGERGTRIFRKPLSEPPPGSMKKNGIGKSMFNTKTSARRHGREEKYRWQRCKGKRELKRKRKYKVRRDMS